MSGIFRRASSINSLSTTLRFHLKPQKNTGHSVNNHRSNQAKNGLYHGKEIRKGNSVSHSKAHTLRKWYPNVLNKKVFSAALNDWVRFKMTAKALKVIDDVGGVDNYIMGLDEKSVSQSKYVTKTRFLITAALFHKGELPEVMVKKMKYDSQPPPSVEEMKQMFENYRQLQLIPKQSKDYEKRHREFVSTHPLPVFFPSNK